MDVLGNLLHAKISQSMQGNEAKGEKQVANFMPWYDGPYTIIDIDKDIELTC